MELTMNNCVNDVLYLHKMGKLLANQKGMALAIIDRKLRFLLSLLNACSVEQERKDLKAYIEDLRLKRHCIGSDKPRFDV